MSDTVTVTRIPCTECSALAILYQWPHKQAGIWECASCGASDNCTHENTHIETVPTDFMRDGEPDQYDTDMYICDLCNCTIPTDVADPAVDRADAMADMQLMEALGK